MHPALSKYFGADNYTPEQQKLMDSFFHPLTAKKNEILVHKGSVARYLYFVIKGCVRIFLTDGQGNESTRYLVFENSLVTAFPSFILRQPSSASIQCLEPCELLALSYEDRDRLMKAVPAWETAYRIRVELEYVASIERIENFITMDARTRYNELLKKNPQLILKLPSRIVAGYLGISQETLSRLKSKK